MNRIPKELDLSPAVGEFTTQVRVGQYDLQFTLGRVNFAIESPVLLFRDGRQFARWEAGKWPEVGFYEIMNTDVKSCRIETDRLIVLEFANGVEMHLEDAFDQYESIRISFEGDPRLWVI